jgi:hypothetical protein
MFAQLTVPADMHVILLTVLLMMAASSYADDEKTAPPVTSTKEDSPELKKGKERLQECRKLFSEGKQDEAIKLAINSIDVFVAPYPQLRWIDIGVIETEKYRVIIHVNTTEDERASVKKYIVRPYTFCVFPKEQDSKLIGVIDFEHGYDEKGVLETAALGRYTDGSHLNYGIIDTKSNFTTVRDRALELIKKDIIKPAQK